jgi:hypothetical protein
MICRSTPSSARNPRDLNGPSLSGKIQMDAQGLLNGTAESLIGDRTDPLDESAFVNSSNLMGQDE